MTESTDINSGRSPVRKVQLKDWEGQTIVAVSIASHQTLVHYRTLDPRAAEEWGGAALLNTIEEKLPRGACPLARIDELVREHKAGRLVLGREDGDRAYFVEKSDE